MSDKIVHYVNEEPFDAKEIEQLSPEQEKVFLASQKKLMWWKFKRHKLAVISGLFLIICYASIIISEFIAPYSLETRNTKFIYAPPQSVHLFHEGEFVGPFVYGFTTKLDMKTLKRIHTPNLDEVNMLRFFCTGDKYYFWA